MNQLQLTVRPAQPVIIQQGENTAAAAQQAGRAASSASDAAVSAATALAAAGPTYASVAAGLLATTSGQSFAVDNGDGTVTVYKNVAGAAVSQRRLLTAASLAGAGGSTLVGFLQSGTGAVARTVQDKARDSINAADFSGYDPTGATDSYAAIMATIEAARTAKKKFVTPGTPLIGTTISLTHPVHWEFASGHYQPTLLEQGSYLLKSASLNGPAIIVGFNAHGSLFDGGGIIGNAGNGGDGIVIQSTAVCLRNFGVERMGRDGIRVGGYGSGDAYYTAGISVNANGWRFEGVRSSLNGRDGISIDDQKPGSAIDANAGLALNPICSLNKRHGIYVDKSYLGSSIISPLLELNGRNEDLSDSGLSGYGLYLATNAQGLQIVGGDVEGNLGGNVFEAVARANRIMGTTVSGTVWDNYNRTGSFTPIVKGATSAGAGTYTRQNGQYVISGRLATVWIRVVWTAHTGTGLLQAALPAGLLPDPAFTAFDQVAGTVFLGGTAVAATLTPNDGNINIITNPGGAAVAVPTSGSLILTVQYLLNSPLTAL